MRLISVLMIVILSVSVSASSTYENKKTSKMKVGDSSSYQPLSSLNANLKELVSNLKKFQTNPSEANASKFMAPSLKSNPSCMKKLIVWLKRRKKINQNSEFRIRQKRGKSSLKVRTREEGAGTSFSKYPLEMDKNGQYKIITKCS